MFFLLLNYLVCMILLTDFDNLTWFSGALFFNTFLLIFFSNFIFLQFYYFVLCFFFYWIILSAWYYSQVLITSLSFAGALFFNIFFHWFFFLISSFCSFIHEVWWSLFFFVFFYFFESLIFFPLKYNDNILELYFYTAKKLGQLAAKCELQSS